MTANKTILISGGGPVGLFCALLLGRHGLPFRLFDINDQLQDDPRAATTHPATLEVLGEAGLVDEMARVGLTAPRSTKLKPTCAQRFAFARCSLSVAS